MTRSAGLEICSRRKASLTSLLNLFLNTAEPNRLDAVMPKREKLF